MYHGCAVAAASGKTCGHRDTLLYIYPYAAGSAGTESLCHEHGCAVCQVALIVGQVVSVCGNAYPYTAFVIAAYA